jgi:cold shock protein
MATLSAVAGELHAVMCGCSKGRNHCLQGLLSIRLESFEFRSAAAPSVRTSLTHVHRDRTSEKPVFGLPCLAPRFWAALKSFPKNSDRLCRRHAHNHTSIEGKETTMATGTVKWFNPTKGYGFIQPQGGGKDVFVHISAVERAGLSTLNEGQIVQYEVVSNRGKESAENLKVG